jgi:hypothetical protein
MVRFILNVDSRKLKQEAMNSNTHETVTTEELARLKAAFESRQKAPRKLSHSVTVAYRQLIAAHESEVTNPKPRVDPEG